MPRIAARAATQAAPQKIAFAAGTTAAVVSFIHGARFDRMPDHVVAEAKRCLIDGFGVMLAGSTAQGSGIVRDDVRSGGGRREATSLSPEPKGPSASPAPLATAARAHPV